MKNSDAQLRVFFVFSGLIINKFVYTNEQMQTKNNRTRIQIAGQSGAGLLSVGLIIIRALRDLGFYAVADREYPSLIKGGHSLFTINVSTEKIHSLSNVADIFVSIDKVSLTAYFDRLKEGGIWIHGYERLAGIKDLQAKAKERNITEVHLPTRSTAKSVGGNDLMQNVVLIGMIWKVLGLEFADVEEEITHKFGKRPKLLPFNIAAAKAGYDGVETQQKLELPKTKERRMIIDGNHAIALGAVHGGVRAYYAYPMSPSSTILTHMADMAKETGVIVKQGEDEITVANLSMGSWYGGTRSMCGTSGGGFDLMTETVSLAGIIETPWVCALVQRPGPATGLPTWTGQGDLKLAIHGGHGEFARIVVSVSDPTDAFDITQHALNAAEKYQCPVIILSDKNIAESLVTVPEFEKGKIKIERSLVEGKELETIKSTDRYKITESGISKRWIPGSNVDEYYFANGDEHDEMGRLDESEAAGDMYAKRVRKLETIQSELPEPDIYGTEKDADISFVGWGSTKATILDMISDYAEKGVKINYLHYTWVHPIRTEKLEQFFTDNCNVHLIEGNYNGQLGKLIEKETDLKFTGKLLKWDGRPFFLEDLENYINNN